MLSSPIVYHTTSHTLKKVGTLILRMTSISMAFMFIGMATGSIVIGMIFFLSAMFAVKYWYSGDAEFKIDGKGIYKHVKPKLRYKYTNYVYDKFFAWDEVKSYKTGSDMKRSLEEYEFLEINLPHNETWQINNASNKGIFNLFKYEFLNTIEQLNLQNDKQIVHHSKRNVPLAVNSIDREKKSSHTQPTIERKRTFYESPWAKAFLWFMGIIIVLFIMIFLMYPQYANGLRIFQLLFIIIPGWVYIYYRLYFKK